MNTELKRATQALVPGGRFLAGFSGALLSLLVMGVIFYLSTYWSTTDQLPSSVPVHHDDYSNYGSGGNAWAWVWIRPFSTLLIQALTHFGPEWLIWSIRLLAVVFVFLNWKLLCEVVRPAYNWLVLILFAVACFASPVIVEYARYTGMVTHLLSGCFGVAAAWALLREISEPRRGYLPLSLLLLVLSVLAKEDFVVLYGVSAVYAVIRFPAGRARIIAWTGLALGICAVLIAGAKFMAASSFLGMSGSSSPYFIDATPWGIARTMWRYLLGAGHPAMHTHGILIALLFVCTAVAALWIAVRQKRLPTTAFLLVAMLSVMLPYSVLPNHVNAYYELIWLPLLLASVYAALHELTLPAASARANRRLSAGTLIFLLLVVLLSTVDYGKRSSIAAWYDEVGSSNRRVLQLLQSQREAINQAGKVCIVGANAFSPWYMHGGSYLTYVMDLHATWYLLIDPASTLQAGMQSGAGSSAGHTVVVDSRDKMPVPCLTIDLEQVK